jgi:ferredoxin
MGSGGLIVMDETTCMVDVAHYFLNFTQDESCGKCVPCRVGTRQMARILERIKRGEGRPEDLAKLEQLAETVTLTSLCGLGQTAPNPVLTTLRYFRDEYEAHVNEGRCPALSCKDLIYYEINEDCVGRGLRGLHDLPEGVPDPGHQRGAEEAAPDRPGGVQPLRNLHARLSTQGGRGRETLSRQGDAVMIELSVDGQKVEVEEGASVLDAARKARIFVPTLCHQRDLSPFGGCRMCTVEIEGVRGFPTSCTTPAEQGMVVRTDTEKIQELRKGVLELMLSEHPSSCLVCEDRMGCWEAHECTGRGRCGLQYVVERVFGEEGPVIGVEPLYKAIPVDRRDPFIDRDDNLCILCGRCVRACAEQSLCNTLDFMHRGGKARVGTAFNRTLMESGCRFCGACVDACPTGTLAERVRRWEGPPQERVPTTCSFCSLGCQFDLGVKNERVIEALPQKGGETGERQACVRGRFSVVEFTRSVRRLKSPLVRRNGVLIEVPWETALEAAAEGIRSCDAQRSALVYSGSCTNAPTSSRETCSRRPTWKARSGSPTGPCWAPPGAARPRHGSPTSRRPGRCW